MYKFPSSPRNAWEASRALYYLARWSGGTKASVWIPQFASLRNHVREISRSTAGSRVQRLVKEFGLWSENIDISATVTASDAASLLASCLLEAPALLELGYPESEGLDFITRMPQPSVNTRRTPKQMRAALHHLGGDFRLFRNMMQVPDPFAPSLRIIFSVWPRFLPYGEQESLSIVYDGQKIPSRVSFVPSLKGYALIVMYDLAIHMKKAEDIPMRYNSFEEFIRDSETGN